MGIFERIRERSSKEEGTEIVAADNRPIARFAVDLESGNSVTSDVEILRGELAKILYEVTRDDVKYVFGDMVESLEELADGSDPRLARFEQVAREGIPEQKELVREMFSGIGWEVPRVLDALRESDDFYMQQVVQLRMKSWSKGRVSLVGDSGFAPSPFTGMGTSLAFIGAYVLAGEISKQLDNIPAALEEYEKVLRPYVEDVQSLPWGIPWIVNPQSAWGVKVWETFLRGLGFLENTGVLGLLSKAAKYLPSRGKKFELPEYEAFKK
ncbi:hypothetical protein CJF30_00004164 [Rutstroemia sp. NJR-2017a BBW]|nr:hypothetical protein CJF30_00004164 [Rutstroemia sp. NJR-2017a BBW]